MLKYEPALAALWFFKSSEIGPNSHFMFCLVALSKFAKFMKHFHSKIGEQILNIFKLPKIHQNSNEKKKMCPFFHPSPPTRPALWFPFCSRERRHRQMYQWALQRAVAQRQFSSVALAVLSRRGTASLLLILAKKSELFQSTNGRTSKCYNAVFLE